MKELFLIMVVLCHVSSNQSIVAETNTQRNIMVSAISLLLLCKGTSIVAMTSFWGYNAFLLYLDLTGKPEFLQRYKIQEEKNVPVNAYYLDRVLLKIKEQIKYIMMTIIVKS